MFSSRNKKNIIWIPPLICSYVHMSEDSFSHVSARLSYNFSHSMHNSRYEKQSVSTYQLDACLTGGQEIVGSTTAGLATFPW